LFTQASLFPWHHFNDFSKESFMKNLHSFVSALTIMFGVCVQTSLAADTIANWTFETTIPTTAGPHLAEGGLQAGAAEATGFHTGTTTYSNPVGNGSSESFSSNGWTTIGDYYQVKFDLTGYESATITWDQARSSTGPASFELQYSTDGTTFQTISPYTVLRNSAPPDGPGTWTFSTYNPEFTFAPVMLPSGVANQATVYVRFTSTVTAVSTGTNRIDNIIIQAEAITGGGATVLGGFVYHFGFTGGGSPIDTVKTLHKEGVSTQELTYDNLINSSRGVNGVTFDIQGLGDGDALNASDFQFQMSPQGAFDQGDNPPSGWVDVPAPAAVTVTPGSPDQVVIQWADNAIQNRWLRITILATTNTGLSQPEVYYIGHLLGETTGPTNGFYTVAFGDITPIRAQTGSTVDSSSFADIDKNGTVSFADISAMRSNVGTQLTNITVP